MSKNLQRGTVGRGHHRRGVREQKQKRAASAWIGCRDDAARQRAGRRGVPASWGEQQSWRGVRRKRVCSVVYGVGDVALEDRCCFQANVVRDGVGNGANVTDLMSGTSTLRGVSAVGVRAGGDSMVGTLRDVSGGATWMRTSSRCAMLGGPESASDAGGVATLVRMEVNCCRAS